MIAFFKMKTLRPIVFGLLLLMAALNTAHSINDDVVVVIHKDNANLIDLAYVAKIYSGSVRAWPDGSPVVALDHPEDTEARVQFSAKVLNRSVANMRAIWSQNIFSGKGLPPKVVNLDSDIKQIVSTNRNAIGYMLASHVDASVKVLGR
jgi:ABC-type phosphate transport system substrate-binding protein